MGFLLQPQSGTKELVRAQIVCAFFPCRLGTASFLVFDVVIVFDMFHFWLSFSVRGVFLFFFYLFRCALSFFLIFFLLCVFPFPLFLLGGSQGDGYTAYAAQAIPQRGSRAPTPVGARLLKIRAPTAVETRRLKCWGLKMGTKMGQTYLKKLAGRFFKGVWARLDLPIPKMNKGKKGLGSPHQRLGEGNKKNK